ncbi:MAG: zinc ABC transporter substrate-binding protein [Gemmatimonadota bacterium]|nr:MAG: zinc ABC transporter substrate-binding protein [Gemmatimonadota bacterium]
MSAKKPYRQGNGILLALLAASSLGATPVTGQPQLKVVTSLPTYAAIAREVAGDLAEVEAIARGDEDPHFVNPRPSFAAKVQRADVFVVTGLDLELWVPAILDRANNPSVDEGGPGHVVAYAGIKLLEVPENPSRAGGDVHVFGNPHIHTDPINGILAARNIAAGLKRVDPGNASTYDANLASFERRVMDHLFGAEIVELLGTETIFPLARNYQFWDFLQSQSYEGRPLTEYLGGWLAQGEMFRDRRMVCYHRNWAYFSARFRIECAMYVEPKPGIPPSPGHVRAVIDFIESEHIRVLFAANYFSRSQVERVADRAGIRALVVPEHVEGEEDVDDYFKLIDTWVSRLATVYEGQRPGHP